METKFITTALSGKITDPRSRKTTTSVATTTSTTALGARERT